ncbi:hypothetical protein ABFS83_08G188900 [Erythranthe nasuta]
MARYLSRAIFSTGRQSVFSVLSRSNATAAAASSAAIPNASSFLFRVRPLVAVASIYGRAAPALSSTRGFATRQTSSSLNDPNPNWSNRPPKETILLDGCDFEHWLVVLEKPEGEPMRDEIIQTYIKTLATVVGSEEEARMKIYSVSTKHYFAFGALVSEEVSNKIKDLPGVRWVLPDSYLDVKNKDYGGEPFINGQAVPYDPKYHEEWVRNNSRANERNRRNDRPRNFDRSRNFERRREPQMGPGPNAGGPGGNMAGPGGNMAGPGGNMAGPGGNMGVPPPNRIPPPPNAPNMGGGQQNYPPNNPGNYPPNSPGNYPPRGPPTNAPPNYQFSNGPNNGGYAPPQGAGGGYPPYQNQNAPPARDMPPPPNPGQNNFAPNRGFNPGQNPSGFAPNNGYGNQNGYPPNMGQNQNGYPPNMGGGDASQNQNIPGRDY